MKILENRPERYDWGIRILSGGQANKIRKQIVKTYVKQGMDLLDLGCGTGSLLIDAANAGANTTGIDTSSGMLAVARNKIAGAGLEGKITLHQIGIVELDSVFKKNSFDVIVSTLAFSELYLEERILALHQIKRLLKPNGKFILASEVRPENFLKRMIHSLVRFPLAVLTYLVAQTGTKPLKDIGEEVSNSGFTILSEQRSFLDSFTLLTAKKQEDDARETNILPVAGIPRGDLSFFKSVWDFIGRWFPNPVEPGLRVIGQPDRNSPVLLTSNFHLTVRRVEKSLADENVFLLVAPTNGINVWCASCGGDLNTHSVITAIKTSRINERVNHSRIILPQFSAPGINRQLLKNKTGRTGIFGPAYSKDIPLFLRDKKTVYKHNRAVFSFPFRLEMLLSMNFMVWIVLGIITLLTASRFFLPLSAFFWLTGFILYAGFPVIPGHSGWLKAGVLAGLEIIAIALFSAFILHMPPFVHWKIMLTITAINLWLGFDLRGIVASSPSEAEWLMHRAGFGSVGHLYKAEQYSPGKIHQNISRCTDCRMCLRVCPNGVFGIEGENKIRIQRQDKCFACTACVTQCAENALFLT